jgi:hypothetical protein
MTVRVKGRRAMKREEFGLSAPRREDDDAAVTGPYSLTRLEGSWSDSSEIIEKGTVYQSRRNNNVKRAFTDF